MFYGLKGLPCFEINYLENQIQIITEKKKK